MPETTQDVSPSAARAALAVLEERGMVRRRPDPSDGRGLVVSLAAAGRSVLEPPGPRARSGWPARCRNA